MAKNQPVLSPDEIEALRSILDMVVPYTINFSLNDVRKYLFEGYNREDAIKKIINDASHDDLTSAKLRLIYFQLDKCYRIRSKDVSPSTPDH